MGGGGGGRTTIQTHLKSLDCALTMVKKVSFVMHILSQ